MPARRSSTFAVTLVLGLALATSAAWSQDVTVFRISDLDLRDPHVFAPIPLFGCSDVTDQVPLGLAPSFNESLEASITGDGDGDGLLDLNGLVIFDPLDQTGPGGDLLLHFGNCTAPMSLTVCSTNPENPAQPAAYSNGSVGTCLAPIPGTTGGYSPTITSPGAPCFASDAFTIVADLGGIPVPLDGVRIGATYVGNPASSLVAGLLMGFLAEADANAIPLPPDVPFVGGQPLSSVLPGGAGCCSSRDDRDLGPDGSTSGWWMYLNFQAIEVPFAGPVSVDLALDASARPMLQPALPNPFTQWTSMRYELPVSGVVRLGIFDVGGRRVISLIDRQVEAGSHSVTWDGRDAGGRTMSPGVYFFRLELGGDALARKIVLGQ